jgi:acetyl-CoA acetyltransferase
MGWGPVPATKRALASAGIDGKDIDHVELNEAFAPQALAVIRDFETLGIAKEKVNPRGWRHRASATRSGRPARSSR